MSFKWKDRYSLGIPTIDSQHKKLFEIGNRAYELAILNDGHDHYDEIMVIVDELLDYTEYHFEYEEALMKKYGYEHLIHQHKEHNFYIDKIKNISEENVDADQQKAILDILDFLSQWISSHILISDRKYADYFKEKGLL
ncbi:MAG: bacteriohemerythrin [Clostridia bacterium]|nr:bacteriohemerythrin [Clostridia bacterium]